MNKMKDNIDFYINKFTRLESKLKDFESKKRSIDDKFSRLEKRFKIQHSNGNS